MELFKANKQWSERPADERFSSLQEMFDVCKAYATQARTKNVPYSDIRVEAVGGDVQVIGKAGVPAKLTHWAFGQLSRLVEAPADYLRQLPATLAVQNLNHGLKEKNTPNDASLMFHANGSLLLRSITSELYTRIWNWEVVKRLLPLQEQGWRTPPARPAFENQSGTRPATAQDVLEVKAGGLSINEGDLIAPAGLYASDHDMFAYMINEKARIADGTPEGLSRGFFVENSEVGASAFKLTTFLYRYTCANHIVWGAKDVKQISICAADHKAWNKLSVEVRKYADESAADLEAKIQKARYFEIAATKDEVLDKLFGMRITTRKNLDAAYELAVENEKTDGTPTTVWGMTQGLTRLSQTLPYADARNDVDRAAGKVLELVF